MNTVELSLTEYAKLRGLSYTGQRKNFIRNYNMPGVISKKIVGTSYIVIVEKSFLKKSVK